MTEAQLLPAVGPDSAIGQQAVEALQEGRDAALEASGIADNGRGHRSGQSRQAADASVPLLHQVLREPHHVHAAATGHDVTLHYIMVHPGGTHHDGQAAGGVEEEVAGMSHHLKLQSVPVQPAAQLRQLADIAGARPAAARAAGLDPRLLRQCHSRLILNMGGVQESLQLFVHSSNVDLWGNFSSNA